MHERRRYGLVAGVDGERCLYICDKIEGFVRAVDEKGHQLPPPCSYLIETGEGLAVHRHPLALLEQDEQLWATWHRFRDTSDHKITLAERRRMSFFEVRLWNDLCVYEQRKQLAELSETPPKTDQPKSSAARFHTMRSLAAAGGLQ